MPTTLPTLALGLVMLGMPAPEGAVSAADEVATSAIVGAAELALAPAADVTQFGSGLPQGPPPPMTMRAQWPVFVGFVLAWIAIIGYVLSFHGRLRRVADDIGRIEAESPEPPKGVLH